MWKSVPSPIGPFGSDCDLKRHGLQLAERGGRGAKKKAVVAVACKLSVLLLTLWYNEDNLVAAWRSPERVPHCTLGKTMGKTMIDTAGKNGKIQL